MVLNMARIISRSGTFFMVASVLGIQVLGCSGIQVFGIRLVGYVRWFYCKGLAGDCQVGGNMRLFALPKWHGLSHGKPRKRVCTGRGAFDSTVY